MVDKHLMLDIETMGNKSGCVITSIAAVPFIMESGKSFEDALVPFYQKISIQSCLDVGLFIQEDTLKWWFQQSKEAQEEMFINTKNLSEVLNNFRVYLQNLGIKDLQVWGNSNRFDMGIIAAAYYACGYKEIPWKYTLERDVRTLVSFAPEIKAGEIFEGIRHNPVDDCLYQIKYCSKIWNEINMNKKQKK